MSKDQWITVTALVLALSTFAILDVGLRFHGYLSGDVNALQPDGSTRPLPLSEARINSIRPAIQNMPVAILGGFILLGIAWPFASFYRHGPREVAALVGCALGSVSGFLVSLPTGTVFLPAILAGAVLFVCLGIGLPRKPFKPRTTETPANLRP